MPTYDYECPKCGHKFELFQKMTEAVLTHCPECNSKQIKRLIGFGSGIIFKGSGFYETDYKRKKQETTQDNKSKEENKSETSSESKKDTKPQTKSEQKKENKTESLSKGPEKDTK